MNDIIIRVARADDASAIQKIYEPYVLNTAITFEYDVPTEDEFKNRIKVTLEKYPYIVAIKAGEVIGYAYAGVFKGRRAYDLSVEMSVYVSENERGGGVGRKLYDALEKILKMQNVINVNACIAYTEKEDEYLKNGSTYFHEKMGYKLVGRFHKCAYKFSKWYDMIWMEKFIGAHTDNPKDFVPFSKLDKNMISLQCQTISKNI